MCSSVSNMWIVCKVYWKQGTKRERKKESGVECIWETTWLSSIHHPPCVGVSHRGRTRVVVIPTPCLPDHSGAVTWQPLILHAGWRPAGCWWLCSHCAAFLFAANWKWTGVRGRGQPGRGRQERRSYLAKAVWLWSCSLKLHPHFCQLGHWGL